MSETQLDRNFIQLTKLLQAGTYITFLESADFKFVTHSEALQEQRSPGSPV